MKMRKKHFMSVLWKGWVCHKKRAILGTGGKGKWGGKKGENHGILYKP